MSQRTEKYKPCPTCETGKYRTDELGREFVKVVNGQKVCADCAVRDIINTLLNKNAEIRKHRYPETLDVNEEYL